MPPQLVVADAPFKVYPAGVIALRATDWLGVARGTLTTEADARAINGEVVRDTQQVTNSIFSAFNAAFAEAEDTLTIDFALLPVEIDMTYAMHLSFLIEGDWDPTTQDTYRASTQAAFANACHLGFYGDSALFLSESDTGSIQVKPRGLDHYLISQFGGTWCIDDVVGDEVLHIRAYARTGTTIEFLLDQVFLIPHVRDGDVHTGDWRNDDFMAVPGAHNDFGSIDMSSGDFVDGADGGDANGKFTWQPYQYGSDEQSNWTGSDGGGDFQKKAAYAGAEYMLRATDEDPYSLYDTSTAPDSEPSSSVCYAAAGPYYRPATAWVEDDFSRTVAAYSGGTLSSLGWGTSPQGFGWMTQNLLGGSCSVNGSVGIHRHAGVIGGGSVQKSELGVDGATATLRLGDFTASGKVLVTSTGTWFDAGTDAHILIGTATFSADMGYYIWIDPIAQTWEIRSYHSAVLFTVVHGPVDISSWYAEDAFIGWKFEIKRYLLRVKVWEDAAGEPGTWDYEDFRSLLDGATPVDYDYASDLYLTIRERQDRFLDLVSGHDDALLVWETHWDDIKVEYTPYGSREDVSIATERPHGTKAGEIVIPDGAQQMVYWGKRDWTDLNFGIPCLVFSSRIWSAVGAAELQQARLLWYWFRSGRGGIISMNWSQALPVAIQRVHG